MWCRLVLKEKWWVTPLNELYDLRKDWSLPAQVHIHDITLRDGEQTPGVTLTKEDKLRIALALDELGVSRIEAGMPVVSDEDKKALKELMHQELRAQITCLCRARKEDIDAALDADLKAIVTDTLINPKSIKALFKWNEEEAIAKYIQVHEYAKEHGLYVSFMAVDAARADPSFVERAITQIVREAKCDSVVIADTFGMCLPDAVKHRVRQVRKWVGNGVSIEWHTHNDFGLGVANYLAAIQAGAEYVHCCVNGLGERTGNPSTEEVALALKLLMGVDAGIRLEKIYQVSQLVAEITRFKPSPTKAVVGENQFTFESGLVVFMWKLCEEAGLKLGMLPYLPELVGRPPVKIVIGKKSGATSIEYKLKEHGITLPRGKIEQLVELVKDEAIRLRRALSDEEFLNLVKKLK